MARSWEPEQIGENLQLLRDACNVYILRDGSRILFVDFGSGRALECLEPGDIDGIEWVLHTHHHRDQCQGDHLLPEGTRVAVPYHERYLFEEAEEFWRSKQIYDSYNNQSTYLTLTQSVPVDALLVDYGTFRWHGHSFEILPAPGHTHGSVCLLTEMDGKRIAFAGDLIHSPGKVWSLTELQHSYGGGEGLDLNAFSLRDLLRWNPDLVLPSHGEPIEDPGDAIRETIDNLREYHQYLTGQPLTIDRPMKRLLPHLLIAPHACCTFYALLSDSGKAMLVDYGAASGNHFYAHLRQFESWELQRFVEHSLQELREDWGVKSIDVVIPTHYHDDHTCGIPHLQKHHGVKLWALEEMVDILENPRNYNVPCLLPYPMRVDRSVKDGETIAWEEYELQLVHFPGQTEYHMAMAVEVDGRRVVFTGDSVGDAGKGLVQPIIYRNLVTADSHAKCARKLAELSPDIIAGGHGGWFEVDNAKVGTLADRAERTRGLFEKLLPSPPAMGVNPAWARLIPYQIKVEPGDRFDLELQIRNHHPEAILAQAHLVLPDGWAFSPERAETRIRPGATGAMAFSVDAGKETGRLAMAADVSIDGRPMGQVAEAIVKVAEPKKPF